MNHIDATITELTQARDHAQELIDGLKQFRDGLQVSAGNGGEVSGAGEDHPTPPRSRVVPQRTPKQDKPARHTKTIGVKSKAESPKPNAPTKASAGLGLDKPTTLGRAMKTLIRELTRFEPATLRGMLEADADYAKLLAQTSDTAFAGNLCYWANQGYLEQEGTGAERIYKVTAAGKEWFTK